MITKVTPIKVTLEDSPLLESYLTYIDKGVDFELNKLRHNKWMKRDDLYAWREKVALLEQKRKQSLLFSDPSPWTYSGLGSWLAEKLNTQFEDLVAYPDPKPIPWERIPTKVPRDYQEEMKEKLIQAKHGAVEVGTGLGKSFVILLLAKHYGLKTVVMTPSVSIANQIYEEFLYHFGERYVGRFFNRKKDSSKLFTIGLDDSLTRIEEGSTHWINLSAAKVFIADESHQCPAKTLAKVCFGLCGTAPYRFFFSGTQMRGDGLDLLLAAITGDIVYKKTVQEGVDEGWLARPMFRMIDILGRSDYQSKDANDMTRGHLLYSKEVNSKAADIANFMVEQGRQVVILVKELEQFTWLLPYLKYEVKFAHGGVTKTKYGPKGKILKRGSDLDVPQAFHNSDPHALVESFNRKEFPILVGTSCITTGTDIQTVGAVIFLRGGKSEIDLRQSIGRGTRLPPGKKDFFFIDFNVQDGDIVHRHAEARREIYASVYPDFEEFTL